MSRSREITDGLIERNLVLLPKSAWFTIFKNLSDETLRTTLPRVSRQFHHLVYQYFTDAAYGKSLLFSGWLLHQHRQAVPNANSLKEKYAKDYPDMDRSTFFLSILLPVILLGALHFTREERSANDTSLVSMLLLAAFSFFIACFPKFERFFDQQCRSRDFAAYNHRFSNMLGTQAALMLPPNMTSLQFSNQLENMLRNAKDQILILETELIKTTRSQSSKTVEIKEITPQIQPYAATNLILWQNKAKPVRLSNLIEPDLTTRQPDTLLP